MKFYGLSTGSVQASFLAPGQVCDRWVWGWYPLEFEFWDSMALNDLQIRKKKPSKIFPSSEIFYSKEKMTHTMCPKEWSEFNSVGSFFKGGEVRQKLEEAKHTSIHYQPEPLSSGPLPGVPSSHWRHITATCKGQNAQPSNSAAGSPDDCVYTLPRRPARCYIRTSAAGFWYHSEEPTWLEVTGPCSALWGLARGFLRSPVLYCVCWFMCFCLGADSISSINRYLSTKVQCPSQQSVVSGTIALYTAVPHYT